MSSIEIIVGTCPCPQCEKHEVLIDEKHGPDLCDDCKTINEGEEYVRPH